MSGASEASGRRRPSKRTWGLRNELTAAAAVLVGLELLLLAGYYTGTTTAPWDFLGSYNAEAFAWWRDGSFLHPTQWMPYVWGGYPAAASVQNSAWYLPVGLVAALMPFTIHAATAVQALHIAFGAAGMYALARRHTRSRHAALFGLVAYFFAVGFFSNAQHVDIVRAFAWAPWVLLCTSPRWPWRRPWAIPLAALIFWQAAISAYPGALAQLAYAVVIWVIISQFSDRTRLRNYLLPMFVSVLGALLMCLLKYLPVVLVRGLNGSPQLADDRFDLSILGTLFFPYDLDQLPNDVTMRSFFLVAPVIPLALLASRRSAGARSAVGVLTTGVVLGLPFWPWSSLVDDLPGMGLSRFQMSDSRVLITTATIFLAATGLDLLRRPAPVPSDATPREREWWRPDGREAAVLAVPVAALLIGLGAGLPIEAWATPWTIVLAASVLVVAARETRPHADAGARAVAVLATWGLIGLAVVSGTQWAYANDRPWRTPRVAAETGQWGATSGALILHRSDIATSVQRPARRALPADADLAIARSQSWNDAYYSGALSMGGYVNLGGTAAYEAISQRLTAPGVTGDNARAFWSAPGLVVATEPGQLPDQAAVLTCAQTGHCGEGLSVSPESYSAGRWSYDLNALQPARVSFNEAFYPGLAVRACPAERSEPACMELAATMGDGGDVQVDVPAGHWQLDMTYRTPGQRSGWIAFWVGALLVLAAPLVRAAALTRSSRRRLLAHLDQSPTFSEAGRGGDARGGASPE